MLRFRLFFGLFTLIVLLWGVGAAALLLMRDWSKRFDKRLSIDYSVISTANGFRSATSVLNSTYIPQLTGPILPNPDLPDRAVYNNYSTEILDRLNRLESSNANDAQLAPAVRAYLETYEKFLKSPPKDHEGRDRLLYTLSNQTQRITDLSDSIAKMAESKLISLGKEARDSAQQNYLFVSTLVLLGTAIAFIIYFQLMRHLVDPVSRLQLSIEEIRKGNYELTLPQPGQGSEFRSVVSAFNDMAAELKHHHHITDDHLMRANLVNRAILEAIPSPVFVLGDDSNIVQINPAAEDLTENLGIVGRLPLKIQKILDECRKTGAHLLPEDPREALLFRIHEEEFYYLPRIFRFVSEEEEGGAGWAILLHNVSRIRWLDDMKTNLLSTVSHEIKTPLTGIRMVLHLLLEDSSQTLSEMQKRMVESANGDCERLLVTLNTLLDLSRAESGATHLDRIALSVSSILERSAALYESAASVKGCRIVVEPPFTSIPDVLADPIRLDEVMNNLVSNAIKHSPDGGSIILKSAKQGADFIRISVVDHGPGVPEAIQGRIFERFFRGPEQLHDGVGLGLFISREIMRAHDGRIGLKERADHQTEFYLDVPIA